MVCPTLTLLDFVLVGLHGLDAFFFDEWEDQPRIHSRPFLVDELLKVNNLGVSLSSTECTTFYEI